MIFTSPIWLLHDAQKNLALLSKLQCKAIDAGVVDDAQRSGLQVERSGSTAIVRTVGPMLKRAGWMQGYGVAGTRETQAALIAAHADDDIDNILWLMDTPGGNTDGLFELAQIVRQINSEKPITVQVDGLLASAGYYVAAGASKIYAAPDNLIGSIGVRTLMVDTSKYYSDLGVKVIPIDTGEHKSAGLEGTEITDAQISETQKIVDGLFESFLTTVEAGRPISRQSLEDIADGRVFLSSEALRLGLIDGIQTVGGAMSMISSQKKSGRSTRAARASISLLRAS